LSRKVGQSLLLITFLLLFAGVVPQSVYSWGNPELLIEINDASFTKQDYLDWWEIWKEPETPLPETPDDFIDWMLQVQEAENMQLYDRPTYRQKVSVFLRARSLMLLKQEEVDSHIPVPTRDDLWPSYEENYVPRFNLRLVTADTEETRQSIEASLASGATLEAAAQAAGLAESSAYMAETGMLRKQKMPEPLLVAVLQSQVGETGGPVSFAHYTYFFEVLERVDGTDEDFETYRKGLTDQWYKQESDRFTNELMERLREKYKVEVNKAVVEKVGMEPLDDEIADLVAVQIGEIKVLASGLQASVAKDMKLRYAKHPNPEEKLVSVRERVIADMLGQTLSGMEALERHYEEKDPFRKTYRFYCQNRLIKELEQAVVAASLPALTDEDIDAAYRESIDTFTRKGLVEVAIVETREVELAQRVEGRLQRGEDFQTAIAPIAPRGVETRTTPLDHLQEPLREALAEMAPGQVSEMIPVEDQFFFLKLIKRDEKQVAPLEMVQEQVKADLKKTRFEEASAALLAQLRKHSRIKVKNKAWKQLVEQLKKEQNDLQQ